MSDSQLKHICDSLYHIVNIKVLAVREKEKNWDFL